MTKKKLPETSHINVKLNTMLCYVERVGYATLYGWPIFCHLKNTKALYHNGDNMARPMQSQTKIDGWIEEVIFF